MYVLLNQQPVIVERCNTARWNRLIETNRMVVVSSFYDHWLKRYLAKRPKSAFTFTALLNILLNFSASSDCKNMINSSLESPSRDESNGSKIIFLGSIDRDLSNNLSF